MWYMIMIAASTQLIQTTPLLSFFEARPTKSAYVIDDIQQLQIQLPILRVKEKIETVKQFAGNITKTFGVYAPATAITSPSRRRS